MKNRKFLKKKKEEEGRKRNQIKILDMKKIIIEIKGVTDTIRNNKINTAEGNLLKNW